MTVQVAPSPKKRIGRYIYIARIAIRQQWTYRAELAMRAISMILFMGVFIALWHTAYAVNGDASVAGYSMNQIVWYLAMTETVALSCGLIHNEMSASIKSGDVAYKLTRPVSYPATMIAQELGNAFPKFFMNLGVAGILVWATSGAPPVHWQNWLAFCITAWLGILLAICISVIIGLLAFWIEETSPVYWIYQKLLFTIGGLFLPLDMFPDWLQRIAEWLPFRYITYVPASTFINYTPKGLLMDIGGQILYLIAVCACIAFIWQRAKSRIVIHGG